MQSTPNIGLALGGGGARGLAHIGVLKVFEREEIPINCLAGTSMGGLIAAAYACGLSPSELEREALSMAQLRSLLRLVDLSRPHRGLLKGSHVYDYLTSLLGEQRTFSDLHIPLTLTAVDLITGQEVSLDQGPLVDAVLATISVPGVFPPVSQEPYELVDGGLLNNLPADVVRASGAEIVIAVDVGFDLSHDRLLDPAYLPTPLPSVFPPLVMDLYRAEFIMINALTRARLNAARPDILIHPPIPAGVTLLLGFTRAAEVIAAGATAAQEAIPKIRKLMNEPV